MTMIPEEGYLLRIFIGESDQVEDRPLYEWLVLQAKSRGMMGFGAHSKVIHTFKIERQVWDLPMVVEIVGGLEKIEDFLDFAQGQIKRGMLATTEKVKVRVYRGGKVAPRKSLV